MSEHPAECVSKVMRWYAVNGDDGCVRIATQDCAGTGCGANGHIPVALSNPSAGDDAKMKVVQKMPILTRG